MTATIFKATRDNWQSSYTICEWYKGAGPGITELVEVSQVATHTGWRVCAWGNDDIGMEKDFLNEADAKTCFLEIAMWEYVNMRDLHHVGFTYA